MDTYLNIVSFAISVGVLVSQWRSKEAGRQLIVVVATILVVTTGSTLWANRAHQMHVDRVEQDIVALLKRQPRTIDHLRDDLLFELREISEALSQGLESRAITSRMEELTLDGSVVRVRIYAAK